MKTRPHLITIASLLLSLGLGGPASADSTGLSRNPAQAGPEVSRPSAHWAAPDLAARAAWGVADNEMYRNRRHLQDCFDRVQPMRYKGRLFISTRVENHRATSVRVLFDTTRNAVLDQCLIASAGDWRFKVDSGDLDWEVRMVESARDQLSLR